MRLNPNARRLALDNGAIQFCTAASQAQGFSINNSLPGYLVQPQSFTMCAWFHTSAAPSGTFFFGLGNAGLSQGVFCNIDSGPNNFTIQSDLSGGGIDVGPVVVTNRWYFYAVTGNGGTLTGYVRQASLDFGTATATNTAVTAASSLTITCGNSFNLNDGLAFASMTDFQIYSYPRTAKELYLQSLQRQPTSMRGLVSYLPCRNIGQRLDLVTGQLWTKNGTASNYKNARVAPPAPEVAKSKSHLWFS